MSNIRKLYGIAQGKGIDVKGMTPTEVVEALKGEKRQNTSYEEILKDTKEEKPAPAWKKQLIESNPKLAVPEGYGLWKKIIEDENIDKLTAEEILNDPILQEASKRYTVDKKNDTILIDTPERHKLRQDIANEIAKRGSINGKEFNGKVNKGFRIDIVIGKPAGGKSSVIVDKASKQYGSKVIDSDEIKKLLPEFDGGNGAGKVHEESSDILEKMVVPKFLNGGEYQGENLVLPIVGRKVESVTKWLDTFSKAGYDVHLSLNSVTALNSIKRAVTRYLKQGRFLDPKYIANIGEKPEQVYEELKKLGGFASYTKYDNNAGRDDDGNFQKAKLIERLGKDLKPIQGD